MAEVKRTPLYEMYKMHGAKTIDFGGWEMPVQFTGIKREHEATRTAVGLFDVSHMGEIVVEGPGSLPFLQKMLTNDVSKLEPKRAQYTIMCYENGGTVDDLIVYQLEENKYLLVVNAANTTNDFDWLLKNKPTDVTVVNCSEDFVQLALQGPKAEKVLQKLTTTELSTIRFFRFENPVYFTDVDSSALVSRTGYTGEDGFEIYVEKKAGKDLWKKLMEAGEDEGIEPIGLGARDTLRFEAKLPLYGQEISPTITPIEAGLGFAVKVDKGTDFLGKEVLAKQKQEGTKRKLVGIEMIDKGIPRHGYEVFAGEESVGFVTTGTQSPTLGKNVGLVLVKTEVSEIGTELFVQVRNKKIKAKVIATPFYKRK